MQAGALGAGEELGPYRIESELGAGGMGKVYAATLERAAAGLDAGTRVAVKVVHPHLMETEGFFKRFLREAQVGQSVRHDNVVRTLDCDAVGGAHFLVMEYVEGQTLGDLQRELDKVPEELCRHVAREICKGLGAIHDGGVVHRDLKPENVLITAEHVVKVMDLARLADEALRLSQSGAFIGSVEYAAPEQFGGEVDHRCDLHALGVLLYEIACGQHPYRADSFPEALKRIREDAPRRLGDVHPQLSPFFEEVVHTLLAKDRDERFASAAELLDVLEDGEESAWWQERASTIRAETKRPLRRIRIPRETALYGRDGELHKLQGLFDHAKAGDGGVLLIEGEAGIGKTRLVDEFVGRLRQAGEDLNFLFGSYPPGGAATAAGGFSTAFREHLGPAGAARYLTQAPLLVPAFDAVLRGDAAPSDAERLTKDSLGTCFVHATRAIAAERPTVLLIDDLHFASEDSQNLFSALAMAAPGHRVLLIGTLRPGVPEKWLANLTRLDQTRQVELTRLGPKDLAALLEDSFRSARLADELGMQIARKSDGNPFFAFEIIRGLREGQFITQHEDGTWVSTRVIEDIEIPSSVLDLIEARIADLAEEERDLLDVASCCGFEFDPSLVAAALDVARIPALKRLGRIERTHRLIRSAGLHFVFDHHQVQEALYAALPGMLRQEYHAAIAEAFEARERAGDADPEDLDGALCVELCEHFLEGARSERALRYLDAALAHLGSGYLNAECVALADRALAVPELVQGRERVALLRGKYGRLDGLGRRDEERHALEEALALGEALGDGGVVGRVHGDLGNHHLVMGRYEEARAAFERSIALAESAGDTRFVAHATVQFGRLLQLQDRLEEALDYHQRYLEQTRSLGNRVHEGGTLSNIGNILGRMGRFEEAVDHYRRALEVHRETGHRPYQAFTTGDFGIAYFQLGRYEEALRLFQTGLRLVREIGNRRSEAISLMNQGLLLGHLGRPDVARAQLEESLRISREIALRREQAYAVQRLGLVAAAEGDVEGAERRFLEALDIRRELGARGVEAMTLLALGRLLAGAGRRQEAVELLRDAQEAARARDQAAVLVLSQVHLAVLGEADSPPPSALLEDVGHRLRVDERVEARFLLWKVTSDAAHLAEAHRLLEFLRDHAPPEYRDTMVENVPLHRDIAATWEEHGSGQAD